MKLQKVVQERSKIGNRNPDAVDKFGFCDPTSCGYIPQINDWQEDWMVGGCRPMVCMYCGGPGMGVLTHVIHLLQGTRSREADPWYTSIVADQAWGLETHLSRGGECRPIVASVIRDQGWGVQTHSMHLL